MDPQFQIIEFALLCFGLGAAWALFGVCLFSGLFIRLMRRLWDGTEPREDRDHPSHP